MDKLTEDDFQHCFEYNGKFAWSDVEIENIEADRNINAVFAENSTSAFYFITFYQ